MPVCMTVTLWGMLGQSVALPNGRMPDAVPDHPAAADGQTEIELGSMGHYASHCSIATVLVWAFGTVDWYGRSQGRGKPHGQD